MLRTELAVGQRRMIIKNSEGRAGFDPEVVGQTGMIVGRVEVQLRMRRHGQKHLFHLGSRFAAFDG